MRLHRKVLGIKGFAALTMVGALALTGCSTDSGTGDGGTAAPTGCTPADVELVADGKLTVGAWTYQPYIGVEDGKLTGLDGEILNEAAKSLCLQVVAKESDWDGMISNVQTSQVDLGLGGVGWGEKRIENGRFTDPIYYSPPSIAVVGDAKYDTIDDFKGKKVGTISGYLWEKAIAKTPGVTAKTYPDAITMFAALNSGDLDVAFTDPLTIPYEAKKNPDSKFKISYFKEPTADQVKATPELINYRQLQIAFYLGKDAAKLEAALNAEIRKLYESGRLSELITKYGGDPKQFLKPADYQTELRKDKDRDAGWTPPAI